MGLPESSASLRETTRPVTALHAIGDGAEAAAAGGGGGSVDAALTKAARTGGLGSERVGPAGERVAPVSTAVRSSCSPLGWIFCELGWPMTVNWRCPGFDGGELARPATMNWRCARVVRLGLLSDSGTRGCLPGTTSSPGGNL